MIETLLVLGCIIFFILLAMAFQERAIMYKDYPTSCDVTYLPEKEKCNPEYEKSKEAFNVESYDTLVNEISKINT